jgi:hypothetical protein
VGKGRGSEGGSPAPWWSSAALPSYSAGPGCVPGLVGRRARWSAGRPPSAPGPGPWGRSAEHWQTPCQTSAISMCAYKQPFRCSIHSSSESAQETSSIRPVSLPRSRGSARAGQRQLLCWLGVGPPGATLIPKGYSWLAASHIGGVAYLKLSGLLYWGNAVPAGIGKFTQGATSSMNQSSITNKAAARIRGNCMTVFLPQPMCRWKRFCHLVRRARQENKSRESSSTWCLAVATAATASEAIDQDAQHRQTENQR